LVKALVQASDIRRALDALTTRDGVFGDPTRKEDVMLVHPHEAAQNTPREDLESLRAELDALDVILLDTVRDRIRCCVRIAAVKHRHDVPMMQPQRIAIVQQRAASYAVEHDIDATFLHCLYDLIIEETCRVEDQVMAQAEAAR
jgi:4-amino-4-deoxychorismate mutase